MPPTNIQQTKQNEVLKNIAGSIPHILEGKVSAELWASLTYEQQDTLTNIDKLPSKLLGVVPESVWSTLSIEQKLEFLFTHDLLPSGAHAEESSGSPRVAETKEFQEFHQQVEEQDPATEVNQGLTTGEVFIEGKTEAQLEFEEVKGEINRIESENANELEQVAEEFIAPEDVKRIQEESGTTFNTNTVPRFAGFQPSDSFLNNVDEIKNGSPRKSGTWAAVILRKFWDALNN